jgi:hypothetical protein
VGRHRKHPDDDLWDGLTDDPWDELRDRHTSHGSRRGSRAGAWAVLGAGCRSVVRASAIFLHRPLDRSSAMPSTRSCFRPSASFAHRAMPSPLDKLPDRSLAMTADVSRAGVLVCFRPRPLSVPGPCCKGFRTMSAGVRDDTCLDRA